MRKLDPALARIIDQIERVRARNNTLWMDVVRLANRVARKQAQAIFRKIELNDAEIAALAKKSAELPSPRSARRRSRRSSGR